MATPAAQAAMNQVAPAGQAHNLAHAGPANNVLILPVSILALHNVPPAASEIPNPGILALPGVAVDQTQHDASNLHYRNTYTRHQPSGGKYHNIRGNTPTLPTSFIPQARSNPLTDVEWNKAYNNADSRLSTEAERRILRVIDNELRLNAGANPPFTVDDAKANMRARGQETEAMRISKACRESGYTRSYAIEAMKSVQRNQVRSQLPSWYQDLNP